jgi:phenylalanyl-tRNA synthetase beta chain
MDETWYSTKRHPDFFDAKGVIESIFDDFEIKTLESSEPFLIPGRQAGIYFDEMKIGFMGEVLPGVRERYDIKAPCVVFELDLSWWQDRKMRVKEFRQIPKLLAVDRDIAIVVEKKILVADIVKTIRKMSELISSVRVFDVYEGKNIPAGKRSIAFRITIQPDERNLTDEEINNIISSIAGMLKKEYNAELRGNV